MRCFRLLILVCLLLNAFRASACECQDPRREQGLARRVRESLAHHSHVFIGEVISADRHAYRVKVIDVFKGRIRADTLTGSNAQFSSCERSVTTGIWVFYTSLQPDGTIPPLGLCGLSGNLSNPDFAVTPPLPGSKLDSAALERYYLDEARKQLPVYLKNWLNEYVILNAYRSRQQMSLGPNEQEDRRICYLALGASALALTITVVRQNKP